MRASPWIKAGGAESREECISGGVAGVRNDVDQFRRIGIGAARITAKGTTFHLAFDDGSSGDIIVVCLPDTVDPRGPKGK